MDLYFCLYLRYFCSTCLIFCLPLVNRYAPLNPNSKSQSGADRPAGQTISQPDTKKTPLNVNSSDRRLYSPFQPPPPSSRQPFQGQQQLVLYSDIGQRGEKWYPAGIVDPSQQEPPQGFIPPNKGQGGQMSQYMTQNQVYKYPQFNANEGDMHMVPTDTR